MKQKLLLCLLMILCVSFGFSQETGKFGFLFKAGSSISVGLTFNVSARVTLRPSLGFSFNKVEYDYENVADVKESFYSLDLGLFYHVLKKDRFTAYNGIEAGYTYRKREIEIDGMNNIYSLSPITTRGYRGSAILGFQYNFNRHLAVFGEAAFGFWQEKADIESPTVMTTAYPAKTTYWGLSRSGFGIILYL